ncbi:MAG: glycosyltransferase family 4 protein [Acidimicrobiales bacterium]
MTVVRDGNGATSDEVGGVGVDEGPLIEPRSEEPGEGPSFVLFDDPVLHPFSTMSLADIACSAGLRTVDVVAWRDFDDPEAGGSELHAHRILSAWAEAGLDVTLTTSSVPDARAAARRSGYRVLRRAGRYAVFPRTVLSGLAGRLGSGDGLVEIWNGMPFFSPIWARCPRITFLHHVHADMWNMVLPRGLARLGYSIEHHLAPPFYRRSRIVTLSVSSRDEIVERLGIPGERVTVSPPGVEARFVPGGERSESPLVVAVGRLVPVKRFEVMIEALVRLKKDHPGLEAVIAGEGYERPKLEALIAERHAASWISLPGYVADDDLIGLYRRAWVLASSSLREGWGMTVTEAGACGTPAVASRISGHKDAVVHDRSGLLFDGIEGMVAALDVTLSDEVLRKRLGVGAFDHAANFTWERAARDALAVLASEALSRK